jgi:hypothetical protein
LQILDSRQASPSGNISEALSTGRKDQESTLQ